MYMASMYMYIIYGAGTASAGTASAGTASHAGPSWTLAGIDPAAGEARVGLLLGNFINKLS